jgi:hypothetical protein
MHHSKAGVNIFCMFPTNNLFELGCMYMKSDLMSILSVVVHYQMGGKII